MNPSASPIQPDPQSVPPVNPPVFKNPLAQGYDAHSGQLPVMSSSAATQPTPLAAPAPVITPRPYQPPVLPTTTTDVSLPVTPPVPPQDSAAPLSPPAQPVVSQLADSPIQPAPVRLAPEPKADDYHAAVATQTAHATPFGSPVSHVDPAATPTPVPAKKSSQKYIVAGVIAVAVAVISAGAVIFWRSNSKKPTPTTSPSTVAASQRDTQEKPVQPFAQKLSTDCYVLQAPVPVTTTTNKDCLLDVRYGEQKISSITVSPQREFDIVANDQSGQASDGTTRFDTAKYLDALIANAISKDLIVTREKTTVGGLEATKVVGKQSSTGGSIVAYVFIVLPEGDRKFGEKTFVAFIVTGAYNDEYSRKGFDQALTTWSWK